MVSRGIRNKNPFNIRVSKHSWLGKVRTCKRDKEFEEFRVMDYGIRAGIQLLRGYIIHGFDTPARILNRFAPSSENDTKRYLDFVCIEDGLSPDCKVQLSSLSFYNLCKRICKYESGYDLDYDYYISVCKRFRII